MPPPLIIQGFFMFTLTEDEEAFTDACDAAYHRENPDVLPRLRQERDDFYKRMGITPPTGN